MSYESLNFRDVLNNWYQGPIHEEYWMKVVYDIESETHSGYCSDGYDFETKYSVRTFKFRIPQTIDIHDTSSDNIDRLLNFFEIDRECCGYCKCYTTTTITAIRIGTKGIYTDLYRFEINRTKEDDSDTDNSDDQD